MPRLVAELHAQFAESAKLEQAIKANLEFTHMASIGISEFTFGYAFLYEQTHANWGNLRRRADSSKSTAGAG